MIRIERHVYKISLVIFFGAITFHAQAQLTIGSKGLGMGQATTALSNNHWAIFSNPAFITNEQISIGFYGLRNYGFTELTDISAVGSIPTKIGTTALGFHRYGDNLFSETRIRLGYKNFWRMLHFGFVVNYNHISFGENYGSGSAVGVDAGIAAKVTDQIWFGAKAANINRPRYNGIDEELPRNLSIGFSYELNDIALLSFDVLKDVRFPISYRSGLEIRVIENLKGRVGITTEPLTYSFGFGYGQKRWAINVAVQKHQLLGFSPGLDIMLYF